MRQRIQAVTGISQVTRAMKMVAAARLKKSRISIQQARPYATRINDVLKHLLPSIDRRLNRLLEVRPPDHVGFVIVTADRGLCGSFNANILQSAVEATGVYDPDRVKLLCVGKKGRDFFRRRGYTVIGEYVGFWNDLDFRHAVSIVDQIKHLYVAHDLDQVIVIFNEFKSALRQDVVRLQFLPLVVEEDENQQELPGRVGWDYLFEPSPAEIIDSLVPLHLNVQMWRILLESNAAEQAARMMAMENATENARDMIRDLTGELNQLRQAAITREILEVVGGADALKFGSE
ncbi:MAG: ATP synthase F1 subunit gamma [Fidelibacterota bacterium]